MTPEELHKAVEEGLGAGGRMDNAHEVLWDECQALRAERDQLKTQLEEARAALVDARDALELIEKLTFLGGRKPGNLLIQVRDAATAALSISTPVKPPEGT